MVLLVCLKRAPMKEPNTQCLHCGQSYHRAPSQIRARTRLTCSRACAAKVFRESGTWVLCQCCDTKFYRRRNLAIRGLGKFCSRKCEAKSRPNPSVKCICQMCNKEFLCPWHAVNVGSGGKFCSRTCTDKYKRKLRKRGEQEMFTQWQKREWLSTQCAHCGSTKNLELDHKTPRFAGGKATRENAQTLCRTCNRKKFWETDYPLYQHLLKQRVET